jgi:hypothetical protein
MKKQAKKVSDHVVSALFKVFAGDCCMDIELLVV